MTREYIWIVCRDADDEVMGAVGWPVLTPEETAALALKRREWLEARYPGAGYWQRPGGSQAHRGAKA